jgi:tripartite-type tricarboxylate transporter receptor subunit TctC
MNRRQILRSAAAVAATAFVKPAFSQGSFPDRPIRLVLPFGPGGSMDLVARTVANEMPELIGQQMIVDNRPGAGGSTGPALVASSPPDGYTLLLAAPSQIPVPLALKTKTPYDIATAFTPVTKLAEEALVLMSSKKIPASTFPELVAYLKANPGKVDYGSAGVGSLGHLAGELFKAKTGVDIVHIPYKSAGGTIALANGEVGLALTSAGSAKALFDKINVLASLGDKRVSILPDTPTALEFGVAGLVVTSWAAVFAPAGTPKDIVEKLDAAFRRAVAKPNVQEAWAKLGIRAVGMPTAEFTASLQDDLRMWTGVVEAAGIKLN